MNDDALRHPQIVESRNPGPPALQTLALTWADESHTEAFARQLAQSPHVRNCFIALHGDLGAGKTTFVRHLLRALGVTGRIKSPTYAVVEPHEAGDLHIWHFDFYRFSDPREWEDAGFRELFAASGIKVAEWPQNAAGVLPTPDLEVHLHTLSTDARRVTLHAGTLVGLHLLNDLRA